MEGAQDRAFPAAAGVDLLRGALGGAFAHVDELVAREALRRFRPHLVEADDDASRWSSRVEVFDGPLFAAKSGSTRSPNQVSCLRQRKPSLKRSSSSRLRFMVMPLCSLSYVTKRSSVHDAKGNPNVLGVGRAIATISPTCSLGYVLGRPLRVRSSKPARPRSAKRCSQR